jgi:hypothetical protein
MAPISTVLACSMLKHSLCPPCLQFMTLVAGRKCVPRRPKNSLMIRLMVLKVRSASAPFNVVSLYNFLGILDFLV